MITAINVAPEQKQGAVLKTTAYQGQWCYLSGEDANGEPYATPVSTTGIAGYHASRLFPIQFWPKTSEDEETYQNATGMPSGTRVVCYVGPDVVIEDDYVYTRVGSGTFVSGTVGDYMYLNASGYLVCTSGATTSVGATPVAVFMGLKGTHVLYKKIIAHSGITNAQ